MSVSPQEVKRLREKTGAGMGDCKKALVEASGDFATAEKILKKQGLASAAKRSDRQTSQGAVFFARQPSCLVMVEVRCETDFVAMNEEFRKLGETVAEQALREGLHSSNDALDSIVKEGVLTLKENLNIGSLVNLVLEAGDMIETYSHNNGLIGVVVVLNVTGNLSNVQKQELSDLGRSLAMHAAAYQPAVLDASQIEPKVLAEQEEIFRERAEKENIPEKARAGYVQGQLKKWKSECCFVEQGFVKEPKSTVAQVIQEFSRKNGVEVKLKNYKVIKVGAES